MADIAPLGMSKEAAARIIAQLTSDSSNVTIVDECSEGAWQETVATRQIYRCLEAGAVLSTPRFNTETGYWECRMGRFAAGQDIVIDVAIKHDRSEVLVVNVCSDSE